MKLKIATVVDGFLLGFILTLAWFMFARGDNVTAVCLLVTGAVYAVITVLEFQRLARMQPDDFTATWGR
jgi:hypothetical protein